MATAYELIDQRTATIGRSGSRATRRYYSLIDSINDDPLVEVKALRSDYDAEHPQHSGLVVFDFDIAIEPSNPFVYYVTVIYLPAFMSGFGGWLGSVEFGSETERLVQSLPYRAATDPLPATAADGEIIGSHFYDQNEEGEFRANVSTQDTPVKLKQRKNQRREGIERVAPITTITMRRTIQRNSMRQIAEALTFKAHANSAPFMQTHDFDGYSPGSVIFASMSVGERPGLGEDRPGHGLGDPTISGEASLVYDIQLSFKHRSDGRLWTPVEFIETYTDTRGFESPVYTTTNPPRIVNHWYKVYESGDLNRVMEIFDDR
jgi:hypothetical protein